MKKFSLVFLKLIILFSIILCIGCDNKNTIKSGDSIAPEVSITSPVDGDLVSGDVAINISASDNIGVVKIVIYIDGEESITDDTSPWEYTWSTDSYTGGTIHTILVKAYDAANNFGQVSVTVTIASPFTMTFNNAVFTNLEITVSGQGNHTIEPDGSLELTYSSNPGSITYSAETSGKTTSDTQIGELISWGTSYDVSGLEELTRTLVTSSGKFFIYIINTGTERLTPFYVNYGESDETVDYFVIPPDGVKYGTGYYYAHTNTEVRAYWEDSPSSYSYWVEGSQFTLPWEDSQSVILTNTSEQQNCKIDKNHELTLPKNQTIEKLHPAKDYTFKFEKVGEKVVDNGKRK